MHHYCEIIMWSLEGSACITFQPSKSRDKFICLCSPTLKSCTLCESKIEDYHCCNLVKQWHVAIRMTSYAKESLLSSRCIVIIFKDISGLTPCEGSPVQRADSDHQCVLKTSTGNHKARDLFDAFVTENKGCFWNPHLEESIRGLKYIGCIEPVTVLVGGRSIFQDTVLAAWTRRVLRSPSNHTIENIGELSSFMMRSIPQAHFTPLPEVLCQIISDLTISQGGDEGSPGSRTRGVCLDAVLDAMQEAYSGMEQLSEDIVYETLGSLMKERKIYHTGYGYAIVTPDTFQLSGCFSVQDNHLIIGGGPTGTIHIPIPFTPPSSPQAAAAAPAAAETRSISCQTEQKTAVSDSDRSPDDKEKTASSKNKSFLRGGSFRKKERKDSHSLSRSFSDSPDTSKDINLNTNEVHQEKDKGDKSSLLGRLFGRNKANKSIDKTSDNSRPEIVTFSGQFPPPDWTSVRQNHAGSGKTIVPSKSHTWHHGQLPTHLDAKTQSDFVDDEDEDDQVCPVHKASTFPGNILPSMMNQYSQPNDPDYWHKVYGFHSSEQSTSTEQLRCRTPDAPPDKSKRKKSDRRKSDHQHPHTGQNTLKPRRTQRPVSDVSHNSSQLKFDSFHAREGEPSIEVADNSSPHGDAFDDLNMSAEHIERPSHVSRIFKKYREMKNSSCEEQHLHGIANPSSQTADCRESGVNCVGSGVMANNLAQRRVDERVEAWRETVHNDLAGEATKQSNLTTNGTSTMHCNGSGDNLSSVPSECTVLDKATRASIHHKSQPTETNTIDSSLDDGEGIYDSIVLAGSDKNLCGVEIVSRPNIGARVARVSDKSRGACCTSSPLTSSPCLRPRGLPPRQPASSSHRASTGAHSRGATPRLR